MAFSPRSKNEILTDMINFVKFNTAVTDFTVGSVVRTILEAAAIEDDEQYFQMVQLLDAFSVNSARGSKLDLRVSDFGIVRRSSVKATVPVRFYDNSLVQDQLAQDQLSGSSTVLLFDSAVFPTTGFPYTIRLGEGKPEVQDRVVSANDITLNKLTLTTTLTSDLAVGDRVSVVTGASSRTISLSTGVSAPATATQQAKTYRTTEPAFIVAGNFLSNEVSAVADTAGTIGNVAASRVTQFTGSAPFQGAGVTNPSSAAGGLNRETDSELRARALDQIQSLSRGTVLAVKTGAIGVEDPITKSKSTSASLLEDFEANEVRVYIDDGTGLVPDSVSHAEAHATVGTGDGVHFPSTSPGVDDDTWPSSGYAITNFTDATLDSTPPELFHYSAKNDTFPYVLYADTAVTSDLDTYYVDALTLSAEEGQTRFNCHDFPIVRGAFKLYRNTGTSWTLLTLDTDYRLNKGTGEVQLTIPGGLIAGDILLAHYTYYTNLVREVQKVLEGDPLNSIQYPGVKAAGVFLSVEAPAIKRINIIATISALPGYAETDLVPLVRRNMENYVKSLKIGEDVIRAKLIDVAYNVTGIADVHVLSPTTNTVVLENELPLPNDSSGNSLVVIS